MGASGSKKRRKPCHERRCVRNLTDKMRLLNSEKEAVMVVARKEAEWAKEKRKLKEEVKALKKMVEEKEEKIEGMERYWMAVQKSDKGWPLLGTSFLSEQLKEERARRDEVVEKWKQLYLAIKTELDDLIQRTHGDVIYWKVEEEETIEEMKKELKIKEETIEALRARIASMEKEGFKRKREMDILKQSLRILGSKMNAAYATNNKISTTLGQCL
ncbi:NADP-dependent alkenal double bond reductase P1-like [Hibiscus syriacus]|uniref:NADP-dependent alkenal double bond reductase P1-like n=1 Tax=Hibiscus syriacus TaxID=106335 RepID=A0A6A3A1N7_HIBSY|nr:cilia- and flagella-associated protein 58-like [Hibiscus syriacus]KAE8698078.1 NADP-dependent alkenal double bond reductase P1-like [Hibiscus syriacus]